MEWPNGSVGCVCVRERGSLELRTRQGPHPFSLFQLLRKLLQRRGMPLSHVLDLSFVVLGFVLESLFQLCYFLLTFRARDTLCEDQKWLTT